MSKLCTKLLNIYLIPPEIKDKFGKHPFNPLLDNKILDWSKLKQIADDILKCI